MEPPRRLTGPDLGALPGGRPLPERLDALWVVGRLESLARPTVAVVGTRAASHAGRALARRFARELAAAGCCIVSGLALGIDACGHEGALDAGAPTLGVLGSGHGRFFPARNRGLAERVVAGGGAVLSPFAPDEEARPWRFLERNAVVAALADAVLVVEAPARSGALNTATWAAGRIPVLAVPGDVDRPHVAGCHALIRDGATLARSSADVLAELRIPAPAPGPVLPPPAGTPLQLELRALLRDGERTLDELARETGSAVAPISAALSMMALEGLVEERPGTRYALRR